MLPVSKSFFPSVSRYMEDDWSNLFDWSRQRYLPSFSTAPSVNIKEDDDRFIVEMAAPGMKKDDFQVELNNNVLTLKSEKTMDLENENDDNFARREFSYHTFQRSFSLDDSIVDSKHIEAKYEDGILRVLLPKKEEVRDSSPKKITIS